MGVSNKKAIINPKNMDDSCFEYSITVALHHNEVIKHPERIQDIHHYFSCEYSRGYRLSGRNKRMGKV